MPCGMSSSATHSGLFCPVVFSLGHHLGLAFAQKKNDEKDRFQDFFCTEKMKLFQIINNRLPEASFKYPVHSPGILYEQRLQLS